jgi:phosphatidate cytidylyltransferase
MIMGGGLLYISCLHPAYLLDAIFFALFFLLFMRVLVSGTPSGSMAEIGPLGIGLFYIAGFLSFHWFLRTEVLGMEYVFLLYTSVWIADSMAYYVGTYIGKRKLCPALSPNKTYEGAFGSIVGGSAGALLVKVIFRIPNLTIGGAVFIGAILGAATIAGDLIESMFKRDAGVKDSSTLIPGHGGILDKIDGMLVSGPVLYFLLRYF